VFVYFFPFFSFCNQNRGPRSSAGSIGTEGQGTDDGAWTNRVLPSGTDHERGGCEATAVGRASIEPDGNRGYHTYWYTEHHRDLTSKHSGHHLDWKNLQWVTKLNSRLERKYRIWLQIKFYAKAIDRHGHPILGFHSKNSQSLNFLQHFKFTLKTHTWKFKQQMRRIWKEGSFTTK